MRRFYKGRRNCIELYDRIIRALVDFSPRPRRRPQTRPAFLRGDRLFFNKAVRSHAILNCLYHHCGLEQLLPSAPAFRFWHHCALNSTPRKGTLKLFLICAGFNPYLGGGCDAAGERQYPQDSRRFFIHSPPQVLDLDRSACTQAENSQSKVVSHESETFHGCQRLSRNYFSARRNVT